MNLHYKAACFLRMLKRALSLHILPKISTLYRLTTPLSTEMVPSAHFLLTTAQFLVDDAMQILSSLSHNHKSPDQTSTSIFVRFSWRIFDILKSFSFLRYSSQEEPLRSFDSRQTNLKKAMQLLTKAAESDNSDAMYLLGELNFVYTCPSDILIVVRKLFCSRLSQVVQMVPKISTEGWKCNSTPPDGIYVRHWNWKCCCSRSRSSIKPPRVCMTDVGTTLSYVCG
jgi:hypothetical protein